MLKSRVCLAGGRLYNKRGKIMNPKTSYLIFYQENQKELMLDDPSQSCVDLAKTLGSQWRAMTAEEKQPYVEKSKMESNRYKESLQREMERKNPKKAIQIAKGKVAPKKPRSSFLQFFLTETAGRKSSHGRDTATQLATQLGQRWKGMSSLQKKPYEEMAAKDRLRYKEEMLRFIDSDIYRAFLSKEAQRVAEYKQSDEYIRRKRFEEAAKRRHKEEVAQQKEHETKVRNERLQRFAKKEKPKRAPTSYFLFHQEAQKQLMQSHPDLHFTHRTKLIGAEWNEMSEVEKQPFIERSLVDQIRVREEMITYKARLLEVFPSGRRGKGGKPPQVHKSHPAPPTEGEDGPIN